MMGRNERGASDEEAARIAAGKERFLKMLATAKMASDKKISGEYLLNCLKSDPAARDNLMNILIEKFAPTSDDGGSMLDQVISKMRSFIGKPKGQK
jgi:hypothetical protein